MNKRGNSPSAMLNFHDNIPDDLVSDKTYVYNSIIGSDNGLSPGRGRAIIWTNAGILLIRSLGTNLSEISIGIQTFSFKKMHLKMSSAKWCPFCLGLNVLITYKVSHCHRPWCDQRQSKMESLKPQQYLLKFCLMVRLEGNTMIKLRRVNFLHVFHLLFEVTCPCRATWTSSKVIVVRSIVWTPWASAVDITATSPFSYVTTVTPPMTSMLTMGAGLAAAGSGMIRNRGVPMSLT